MAKDWRDIKAQKIEVIKALDPDGNPIAVAQAGFHHETGARLFLGCAWNSYLSIGDLSCGSQYYEDCDVFIDFPNVGLVEIAKITAFRSVDSIELDIRKICSTIESVAIMGCDIAPSLVKLEDLRLEMRKRLDFDFDAELNAD